MHKVAPEGELCGSAPSREAIGYGLWVCGLISVPYSYVECPEPSRWEGYGLLPSQLSLFSLPFLAFFFYLSFSSSHFSWHCVTWLSGVTERHTEKRVVFSGILSQLGLDKVVF